MIKPVFCVHDSVSTVFALPFCSISTDTAVRDFRFAVNDPSTGLNKSPNDYTLYQIATFDDSTGHIEPVEPISRIANASSLVERKTENHV